jgi:hypothetical protein
MFGMNPLDIGPCNPIPLFYQSHYNMYPKIVHPTIVYPTIYQQPEKAPLVDISTFCEAEPLIKANKIKRLKGKIKKAKKELCKMASCFS